MAKETHEILKQAFGKDAMVKTHRYEWFKWCRMSVEDDICSGLPCSGRNDQMKKFLKIVN